MKCVLTLLVGVVVGLFSASCAQPLQKIVDEHRSAHMSEVYANQPVTYGAADGIGSSNAEAHAVALTETSAHSADHQ